MTRLLTDVLASKVPRLIRAIMGSMVTIPPDATAADTGRIPGAKGQVFGSAPY